MQSRIICSLQERNYWFPGSAWERDWLTEVARIAFMIIRYLRRELTLATFSLGTLAILSVTPALAAPQIGNVSLRGLQIGATTTLSIDGTDLLPSPKILLQIPNISQTLKPGATANRCQLDVTLPTQTPAGMYHLRIANAKGVSNAILIGVDDLIQVPFAAQVAELPAA